MIIYTPIPMEMSLESSKAPEYREIEMLGTRLVVEQTGIDQCRVVRLMSTDPADYLKPEFQPGATLTLQPTNYFEDKVGEKATF